jgi:hypothetical protein
MSRCKDGCPFAERERAAIVSADTKLLAAAQRLGSVEFRAL